jgi:hypothetical protein
VIDPTTLPPASDRAAAAFDSISQRLARVDLEDPDDLAFMAHDLAVEAADMAPDDHPAAAVVHALNGLTLAVLAAAARRQQARGRRPR